MNGFLRANRFLQIVFSLSLTFSIACSLGSCSGTRGISKSEMKTLVRAGQRLGMYIDRKDDHALMIESSKWIGVPYRYGGNTRSGIDCSGLVCNIYRNAYRVQLSRNSQRQLDHDVQHKVRKRDLEQGDLVFFSPQRSQRNINHVGIYLKDGKFIHASSSRGVRVDLLNSKYWKQRWVTGGRVNHRKK